MKLENIQRYYMAIVGILLLQLNLIAILGTSYIENNEPDYWDKQKVFFDFAPGLIQVTFENLYWFFNLMSALALGLVVLSIAVMFTRKFWDSFGGGRKPKIKPSMQ